MRDEKNNSDVTNEALEGDECNDGGGKSENHIDEIFKKVLIVKISKTIDSIFFSFLLFFSFPPPPVLLQVLDCISIAFGVVHSPGA